MYYNYHYVWEILKNKELNELYLSIGIRDFAIAMIGIFTPIYLLDLNYNFSQVMFFNIVMSITTILSGIILVPPIIKKFGVKHSMILSVPITILFYLMLYSLENYRWIFYPSSVVGGLSLILFFMGYHIHFANYSKKSTRGKETSVSYVLRILFHVIGPLIGGLILTSFGFKPLFVIVSFLFLISGVPLLRTKDVKKNFDFSIRKFIFNYNWKDCAGFLAFGSELALWVVWSIFIYNSIIKGYTGLGLASSLVALFMMPSVLVVGKLSDLYRNKMLKIGGIASAGVWFVKLFVSNILHVNIISSLYGLVSGLIAIPFTALSYDKAKGSNVLEFTVFREVIIHLGKLLVFIIVLFIDDLQSSFLIGVITGFLYLLF